MQFLQLFLCVVRSCPQHMRDSCEEVQAMSQAPSSLWVSPAMLADSRPSGDEPGPGWWGWLAVLTALGMLGASIVLGIPH